MRRDSKLSNVLHNVSTWVGIAILLVSWWLNVDGFDGKINATSTLASTAAFIIGAVFALSVSVMQFIFTSDYKSLNPTLLVVGMLSYAYSIWTNAAGARNILNTSAPMSWVIAIFADVVAEPMIAWGVGESLVGDIIGNFGKIISGDGGRNSNPPPSRKAYAESTRVSSAPLNNNMPRNKGQVRQDIHSVVRPRPAPRPAYVKPKTKEVGNFLESLNEPEED